MEVGDKVKVKSWEEILETLDDAYQCVNSHKDSGIISFNKEYMFQYVNLTGTISEINKYTGNIRINFTKQDCTCWWHPSWVELIPEQLDVDKNCSSKWLIFCMIFQYLSGNCPNPNIFKYFFTPRKEDGGFDFSDFEYDFLNIQKGDIPFPDWPILNIPLDKAYTILEHCYKYGSNKKDLKLFTKDVSSIILGGFRWIRTPEGETYWTDRFVYYKGMTPKEEVEESKLQTKSEILTTQIKTESYENKLQRKKSNLIRGTVPEGSIVCGRKRKASISIGHLSNKVCSGI